MGLEDIEGDSLGEDGGGVGETAEVFREKARAAQAAQAQARKEERKKHKKEVRLAHIIQKFLQDTQNLILALPVIFKTQHGPA